MSSVADHYASHLGPVYAWMAGGVEAALARGAHEVGSLQLPAGGLVVDLGAGFGMHAIPLARAGHRVLAIDNCAPLLEQLAAQGVGLPIRRVLDDLSNFPRHLDAAPQAICCLGDTLTHLDSLSQVQALFARAAAALPTGGRLVLGFRDYTRTLDGDQRFIPVRSDGQRILTCFLEYAEAHVTVHDLLHERDATGWQLRVSSYRKLRLASDWVDRELQALGFVVTSGPGPAGMLRVVAQRV